MTSGVDSIFAPRLMIRARRHQAKALRSRLRFAIRGMLRGLDALKSRLAHAAQYHRELELLMHADDRLLADIGLTRFDVVSVAQDYRGWLGRRDALQSAAVRHDEAVATARARRAG